MWSIASVVDSNDAPGFEIYKDGVFQWAQGARYLYGDTFAEIMFADYISDDGYVAGHYVQSAKWSGWTNQVSDSVVFVASPEGGMVDLGVAGTPIWMDNNEWVCVGSSSFYAYNAATGHVRDTCEFGGNEAPVSEPSVILCLLGSALLLLLRQRGSR